MENDLRGNKNWLELARGSSYRESTHILGSLVRYVKSIVS